MRAPIILADNATIPSEIKNRLNSIGIDPNDIKIAVEGDLNEEGLIMPAWLLIARDSILSIPAEQNRPATGPLLLDEIDDFRIKTSVGGASLQAVLNGLPVTLTRYTNRHRERFSRVATHLRRVREGEEFQPELLVRPDPRFCTICGLVLPAAGSACPRCVNQGAIFWRTFKLLSSYAPWAVCLFVFMLIGIGFDLLPPYFTRILVDDVLTSREHVDWLPWLVFGLAAASLFQSLVNICVARLSSFIGTRITTDVRQQLFDKLEQMSIDYYDKMEVGRLMNRCISDVQALHGFVDQMAQGFLINLLMIVSIGGMLFYLDNQLAFYVLIPVPFVVTGTLYFYRRIYPKYYKLSDTQSKLASTINSALSRIRLVKAFAQEVREAERFTVTNTALRDTRRQVTMSVGTFSPIMAYVFGLGGLIIWFVGGQSVLSDRITLGTLMAFLGYLGMFYRPLSSLSQFSNWLTSFMAASQRVFEILDLDPGIHDKPDAKPLRHIGGAIVFDQVVFGYDPYNPVINNVSFKINSGEMIGIVGRSGSGKTTLINLLCRFYDVQSGSIRIDAHDVRDIRRQDIRNHIGLVLQDPFLFRASISENLAYGRPESKMEDIIIAAKAANAHDFIMEQPAGYDTMLGEHGAGLSGGERQRISIARALLVDPAVLILDEATSSVDTESEQQIQEALSVLCRDRTTIAIAHRLSTLRDADRILVIDSGRLAEEGTHHELMAQEGIYHRLVKIQTQLTSLQI